MCRSAAFRPSLDPICNSMHEVLILAAPKDYEEEHCDIGLKMCTSTGQLDNWAAAIR